MRAPPTPLPPALVGTDGGFTDTSITTRLPLILSETLAHNDDAPTTLREALEQLRDEIARDAPLPPLAPHPSNAAAGFGDAPPAGGSWLRSPWFHVENYFYRRILDACRAAGWGARDPFARQKAAALHSAAPAFAATVLPLADSLDLRALLLRSLWGNRADLSLHTVAALEVEMTAAAAAPGGDTESGALLVDDTAAAVRLLQRAATGGDATVAILLDNCGLELLSDLVLVDGLLRTGVRTVVLFAKTDPVFVSDATNRCDDVGTHVAWIAASAAADQPRDGSACAARLAARLQSALQSGALCVRDDPFFNSPLPFWELPSGLRAQLATCSLVVVKGDANYRRLLGDRHWPHETPFSAVVCASPAPLLALRTCKAGVVCGLPAGTEAVAAAAHPHDWLVSGRYGLAQLADLATGQ